MTGDYQHLDLERLARVIAMGGSGHDGEALSALRQADRSIRAAGRTWHDVLLPGRLIEALTAEAQQLRDELTTLRAAKAAETAVRRRRRRTHQRAPVGIIIVCCLAAMFIISDVICGCACGAVLVANSPLNISGIALPATVASNPQLQRPPVFGVIATLVTGWRPQLRPALSPPPTRAKVSGDYDDCHRRCARGFCRAQGELSCTPTTGTMGPGAGEEAQSTDDPLGMHVACSSAAGGTRFWSHKRDDHLGQILPSPKRNS